MAERAETKNIGLRGIKVADTRISDVDGEKGAIIYRGYNVADLAKSSSYEEVIFLLLEDHLPTRHELGKIQVGAQLGAGDSGCRFGIHADDAHVSPSHGHPAGLDSHVGLV